ncbi:MAG TPA: adenine phosphoribosyltransferase [Candidatus Udaeobacter sp.]|jgi:adenine phosphoribosyltransferase|nr:adenine phosphoribosyltransferase [Candidatus Udaeobacter sp.]
MNQDVASIRQAIRDIPDFPKPGVVFRDITPLLSNGQLFGRTIDILAERYRAQKIDTVLGIESRGFIIGSALAYNLGAGFCIVRKPGKLPYQTHSASYELEYGTDKLEIHVDALPAKARVIIADDLIATGGTAAATAQLVSKLGGTVVECAFVIELSFLKGREKLKPYGVFSLVQYDSE